MKEILTEIIDLKFHPNVSAAAGDLAMKVIDETRDAGKFYLVIEGAVPTKDGVSTAQLVKEITSM